MLKKPNYTEYLGPRGQLSAMYCKICGEKIASMQMRPTSAVPGATILNKFTRHSNYAEIKIALSNPGMYHVTNGCQACLRRGMDPAILDDMYQADLAEMGIIPMVGLHAVEVDKVDYTAQGII